MSPSPRRRSGSAHSRGSVPSQSPHGRKSSERRSPSPVKTEEEKQAEFVSDCIHVIVINLFLFIYSL